MGVNVDKVGFVHMADGTAEVAAGILKPCVSARTCWIVAKHGLATDG
ncbi:MAG: hypothetical protein ACREER_00605 [Alphaproteobacteria bacterium]